MVRHESRDSDVIREVLRANQGNAPTPELPPLWVEKLADKIEAWWKKKVREWKGRRVAQ